MRGRGNGIQKKVYNELLNIRGQFEKKYGNTVRKSEVIVNYDSYQKFKIVNKKSTDDNLYPSNFEGKEIIRPLGDLKCIIFDYDGEVYARFHHDGLDGKNFRDVKIGRIKDSEFIKEPVMPRDKSDFFIKQQRKPPYKNIILANAMEEAAKLHAEANRKGTDIPYIVHPFEVAMILQENGMREEVVAAGLLHDVLEDTEERQTELKNKFGEYIYNLVIGASEELEGRPNKPWKDRKIHTIEYLREAPFTVKCIACADKLSNARSMVRDLNKEEVSEDEFWDRFNAVKVSQQWYYENIVESLRDLEGLKMYQELKQTVEFLFSD